MGEKWFVVVNIYAASRKAGRRWKQARQLLESAGVDFEAELTGQAGNASMLTMDACRRGFRRILAVGGDGTVHDVFNAMMTFAFSSGLEPSDFTLGVVPMGSGNDWIKTIGIGNSLSSAVRAIVSGRTSRQDVVRLSLLSSDEKTNPAVVSYVVNVAGVGIDAEVCRIVNHRKKRGERGKILYIKALLASFMNRRPSLIRVEVDGEMVFRGDFLSIAFGVGKYSGGGLRQTPAAVIDDGLVDVTIVPDVPVLRIATQVYRLFTGSFLSVPELVTAQCREVSVFPESNELPLVEVDGEIVGRAPFRIDVLPCHINVIVP